MKATVFSTHKFDRPSLEEANNGRHDLNFLPVRLTAETAALARGSEAIALFTMDQANAAVLQKLHQLGIRYIVLRSAGFNHVDIKKATALGIRVARVPAYSPYAIAEHSMALILALNRKITRAHNRVREMNFALDGLTGFDLHGKVAGVAGTGKIGAILVKILHGFGCRLLGFDLNPDEQLSLEYGLEYTDIETLCRQSDILSLHLPLIPETVHLINREMISIMKPGVMLINTSRGGLVDTKAVINGLKTGQVGYFGMDVYEEEDGLFFEDHSDHIVQDDVIARLMTFNNVLITSHQAFLTHTALRNIAETTIYNLDCFASGKASGNEVGPA